MSFRQRFDDSSVTTRILYNEYANHLRKAPLGRAHTVVVLYLFERSD